PSFGFCASQNTYYYGYKLHAICGLSGVIHSFDITKANVHDINYLKDIKYEYHDCSIFGDRGYISASMQLNLFESANIRLEVPYRLNQKDWKPTFIPFAKARKRIETDFSQYVGQFMLNRNYAKQLTWLLARVISKITSFSTLQYFNFLSGRPIGHVKYALD
nr:IS982 family transposase [Bacteroidales bacterium]